MRSLLVLACVVLGSGCGDGSGGVVKLQFRNGGDGAKKQGLNARAPSTFGMKLVAVYLAADVDASQNNTGATQMIYLNPACAEDIGHCELGPGTRSSDGAPFTQFVTSYFDFAAPTADVNAALNAQQRVVDPGTYRFARIEFCKGNESHTPNVRWAADGAAPSEFIYDSCSVTSAAFEPALVVTNQAIAVTLSYDLSTAVSDALPSGHPTGTDCMTVDGVSSCVTMPTFVPSAQ